MVQIKAPKGVNDILPDEIPLWRYMEDVLRSTLECGGFTEIRLPIFENSQLFSHSIGAETDIVAKEMYSFQDKGGRSFSLRPEGTASAVRAYLEHSLGGGFSSAFSAALKKSAYRFYYMGPMFRAERPQKGRYRQFHQLGAEVFGSKSAYLDAELLALLMNYFSQMQLPSLTLQLNSLGCPECRPQYKQQLVSFLAKHQTGLCPDCQRRALTNPLRVLDCKQVGCQAILASAPQSLKKLCDTCNQHFDKLKELLKSLEIDFKINPRLVRGLDYYTRTAFEITSSQLGSQNAVAGGGRFDNLVEQLGGPSIPAFGFAIGLERLLLLLQETDKWKDAKKRKEKESRWVYLAPLDKMARSEGLKLQQQLRKQGIPTQMNYAYYDLKKHLKRADKLNAPMVVIMGDEELQKQQVVLRDMSQGTQEDIPLEQLTNRLVQLTHHLKK